MQRVSLLDNRTATNSFFKEFETELFNSLVDNPDPKPTDSKGYFSNPLSFYVSARESAVSESEVNVMLSRLPNEFAEIYRKTKQARAADWLGGIVSDGKDLRLDYYELDLIDFLFNIKTNRVICILGTVGRGKTTFLNYVFQVLRRELDSLHRFVPVVASFTLYPGEEMNNEQLFRSILMSIRKSLDSEIEWRPIHEQEFFQEIARKVDSFSKTEHKRELLEIINFIREELTFARADYEFVFIFDNVDQLDYSSVRRVSSFSRALFLQTALPVILAMRPPAYATHIEADAHKGAFNSFRINLPPLNLKRYLARRMSNALSEKPLYICPEKENISIEVPLNSAVSNIVENILSKENTELILTGICNNNIRKAGRAFLSLLHYRNLQPSVLFASKVSKGKMDDVHPGGKREHVLEGLMLGQHMSFKDNDFDPVVSNVYHFSHPGCDQDHTIQYRILSLLSWAVGAIEFLSLKNWLYDIGFGEEQVRLCSQRMLMRGLMFSPESDYDVALVKHVCKSESGEYYLERLCSDRQYLWHCLPDVPLDHFDLEINDDNQFYGRMSSTIEFLEVLEKIEKKQFLYACESEFAAKLVGSISAKQLLQRRVISAAKRIVSSAKRSTHSGVKDSASEFEVQLRHHQREVERLEGSIHNWLDQANLHVAKEERSNRVLTKRWKGEYEVKLRAPKFLSASESNIVEIYCAIGKALLPRKIFGRLESVTKSYGIDEMARLERSPNNPNVYEGRFVVNMNTTRLELPRLKVSLFAETKPILNSEIV